MATEWDIPDASSPIKQGDLFFARNTKTGAIAEIRLVITADCDISQRRFGEALASLRVISYLEYVQRIWAMSKWKKARQQEVVQIQEKFNRWRTAKTGKEIKISEEGVLEWFYRDDAKSICSALEIPSGDKLEVQVARLKEALTVSEKATAEGSMAQLIAFRSILIKEEPATIRRALMKQANGDTLPEDIYLFPELPELKIGPAVIMLRELRALPWTRACLRTSDATAENMFVRIGRLGPAYKYSVSQAFGALFTNVGLPDTYRTRCATARESCIE